MLSISIKEFWIILLEERYTFTVCSFLKIYSYLYTDDKSFMPVVCSKPVERSVELDDVRPKQHIISDLEDHDELHVVHVT